MQSGEEIYSIQEGFRPGAKAPLCDSYSPPFVIKIRTPSSRNSSHYSITSKRSTEMDATTACGQELPAKRADAPKALESGSTHPLLANNVHVTPLIKDYVESHTSIGGRAQKEKMIM